MFYTCADDFFRHASSLERIAREDEIKYARLMNEGDSFARQAIVDSYIPVVAARVKRLPKEYRSLEIIYRCLDVLEKAVDTFNFLQDGETFLHTLCVRLNPMINRYFAERDTDN